MHRAGDEPGSVGGGRRADALDARTGRRRPASSPPIDLPGAGRHVLRELADDWNASIEDWTYARGTEARAGSTASTATTSASRRPTCWLAPPSRRPSRSATGRPRPALVPADEMVGTDFLALVRFGLRRPDDPRIVSTLAVTDALLRTETPSGPVWHRYNGDGYGEHADGSAFDGTGSAGGGRCWRRARPLRAGGRPRCAGRYLEAMRRMASGGGMLPEQVWDAAPHPGARPGYRPAQRLRHAAGLGPRGVREARPLDRAGPRHRPSRGGAGGATGVRSRSATRATWRFTAPRPSMQAGRTLRLELMAATRVRLLASTAVGTGPISRRATRVSACGWPTCQGRTDWRPAQVVEFTFWWPEAGRWEGRDLRVEVTAAFNSP